MKNSIVKTGAVVNKVTMDNYIFMLNQKNAKKGIANSNEIPDGLIDRTKDYLSTQYRDLIIDSFGDVNKKRQLNEIIQTFISKKDMLEEFPSILDGNYTLQKVAEHITEDIAGLGVIQQVLSPTVTDININAFDNIWIKDIFKGSYRSEVKFSSQDDFISLCQRFVNASKENWSMQSPFADLEFPQMRIHLSGFDITGDGPTCTIRVISKELRINKQKMIESNYATEEMLSLLTAAVYSRASFLITGETGSGKTELLRYLFGFANLRDRIGLAEDTRETYLEELYPNRNMVSYKTRKREGSQDQSIGYGRLIIELLREDIKWMIVQETRGSEANAMIKAGETGHSLATTLHANSALEAPIRLTTNAQEAIMQDKNFYLERIMNVFNLGIHLDIVNGSRRIVQIVEYHGFNQRDNETDIRVLYEYDQENDCFNKVNKVSDKLIKIMKSRGISVEDLGRSKASFSCVGGVKWI